MNKLEALVWLTGISPEFRHVIRSRSGLTLSDIAKLVGVDTSTISRYEAYEKPPARESTAEYARLLDSMYRAQNEFREAVFSAGNANNAGYWKDALKGVIPPDTEIEPGEIAALIKDLMSQERQSQEQPS